MSFTEVCTHKCVPHPSQQPLSYAQMVLGLDKLYLAASLLKTREQVEEHAKLIEAYIEACGWSLEKLVAYLVNEDKS